MYAKIKIKDRASKYTKKQSQGHYFFDLIKKNLPSQLVDPEEQMLNNLTQIVHSHHSHILLCKAEGLDEL